VNRLRALVVFFGVVLLAVTMAACGNGSGTSPTPTPTSGTLTAVYPRPANLVAQCQAESTSPRCTIQVAFQIQAPDSSTYHADMTANSSGVFTGSVAGVPVEAGKYDFRVLDPALCPDSGCSYDFIAQGTTLNGVAMTVLYGSIPNQSAGFTWNGTTVTPS